jgi:hypothetical protein
MVKWLLYIVLSLAPVANNGAAHPYYISVTEIEHNSGEKSIEMVCRIFTDDFEATLKKNFNQPVDLFGEKDKNAATFIPAYINQRLKITADGKPVTFKYLGYERKGESCWCYFEAGGFEQVKKMEIINTLLHDYQDKQINMIHAQVNENKKSYKLDYPSSTVKFEW